MKTLVMNADDFGMTHDVNRGIVEAYRAGVLTQASLMVPCPWAEEAIELAKRHGIPIGVHLTATCEWLHYRWRPLTDGRSLRQADGTMHTTMAAAQAACVPAELEAEFTAQIERVLERGIRPQHLDVHMGVVHAETLYRVCRRFDLITITPRSILPPGPELSYPFTSDPGEPGSTLPYLSAMGLEGKPAAFRAYLERLGDGIHYNACHPGVDGDELRSLTSPERGDYKWARDIRVTDLAALTDPETIRLVDRLGIRLASCGELPPSKGVARPSPVARDRAQSAKSR
jgi:hypothetical protein